MGLGTALDLHAHDPENAIGGGGTFMVAWRDTHLQLRLFSSVVGSDREVQSVGIEYGLGLDYPIYDWLDAGLYMGHRIASTAATDAWLEQSWFLGVQSAQRVWSITEHLHLWVREGIAPAGQRWRRAEAVDGRIRALEQRTDYQARFELGVFVQQEIR